MLLTVLTLSQRLAGGVVSTAALTVGVAISLSQTQQALGPPTLRWTQPSLSPQPQEGVTSQGVLECASGTSPCWFWSLVEAGTLHLRAGQKAGTPPWLCWTAPAPDFPQTHLLLCPPARGTR